MPSTSSLPPFMVCGVVGRLVTLLSSCGLTLPWVVRFGSSMRLFASGGVQAMFAPRFKTGLQAVEFWIADRVVLIIENSCIPIQHQLISFLAFAYSSERTNSYTVEPFAAEDHIISKTSKRKWDAAFGSSSADTYTPDDQLSVQNKQHVNERVACNENCGLNTVVNIVEPGPIEAGEEENALLLRNTGERLSSQEEYNRRVDERKEQEQQRKLFQETVKYSKEPDNPTNSAYAELIKELKESENNTALDLLKKAKRH
ncbi:hypothetical protein Tco_1229780 [Tanacetum coccineum]